jgi:hypothetical protein
MACLLNGWGSANLTVSFICPLNAKIFEWMGSAKLTLSFICPLNGWDCAKLTESFMSFERMG